VLVVGNKPLLYNNSPKVFDSPTCISLKKGIQTKTKKKDLPDLILLLQNRVEKGKREEMGKRKAKKCTQEHRFHFIFFKPPKS
jgi:hypothetical protein